MKFKLTPVCLSLSALLFGTVAIAESENDGMTESSEHFTIPKQQFSLIKDDLSKFKSENDKYFVLLEEAPLALYQGGQPNMPSTSIAATNGSNATPRGKLNVRSKASIDYRHNLNVRQNEAKLHMNLRLKRDVKIGKQYNIAVNGFVAHLQPSEVVLMQQQKGIKAIEKIEMARLDTDSGPSFSGADKVWSGDSINHNLSSKGEGIIVGVIDSGIASYLEPVKNRSDLVAPNRDALPEFHPSFADVAADGYDHTNPFGEGVYVGDCVDEPGWCNDKVIGIFGITDLGDIEAIKREEVPRSKTGQDYNGHGTHTASTAAGNIVYNVKTEGEIGGDLPKVYDQNFVYEQISGVAPHANIIAFQTCDTTGACRPDLALAAVEKAIEHGVDVINYSISSPLMSPWYNWQALAFLSARESGIHVSASAGNSGDGGFSTIRSPANAPWITGVGAATSDRGFDEKVLTLSGGVEDYEFPEHPIDDDGEDEFADYALNQLVGKAATQGLADSEIVYATDVEYKGEGTHSHTHSHSSVDAENFFHYPTDTHNYNEPIGVKPEPVEHTHVHDNYNSYEVYGIDGSCGLDTLVPELVAGKVVICNRGGADKISGSLSRVSKSHAASEAGATGMILINTKNTSDTTATDFHVIPSIHLDKRQGKVLLDWLSVGSEHKVALSASTLINSDETSGRMGSFSSKGPDLYSGDYLVPSISATGVSVLAGGLGAGMQKEDLHNYYKTDADFVYKTGTSMSTPHVTGMYALIKAIRPEWKPAEAQSALMLTAGTELQTFDKVVDGENTYKLSPFHEAGSGLARVDLAVNSGLIMKETYEGYMQADPFGDNRFFTMEDVPGDETLNDEDEEKVVPEGWHGEPDKINLASFSKAKCVQTCSWERTLTATKSATWEVSYSYLTEGITLTSNLDEQLISVANGEDFTIKLTATVDDSLADVWANARVHLTSTDPTLPDVSLPVAVEFVAGYAPEQIEITAHRNVGSTDVENIITIGSDDFTITNSALSSSTYHTGVFTRSDRPNEVYANRDTATVIIPLNIESGTERLVVEVLSSSSPDIDVYIGQDVDVDGEVDVLELESIYFWSITNNALEKLDYDNPRTGVYWIMLHNYGDHYNDRTHDDFDPSSIIEDDVTVVVSKVRADDGSMAIEAPKTVGNNSAVPVTLNWDVEMEESDRLYGKFVVSSKEELYNNIGTVKVDLIRGEDDVKLSLLSQDKASSLAGFDIRFATNHTGEERQYLVTAEIAEGSVLESLSNTTTSDGVGLKSAGAQIEFNQDGNTVSWTVNQEISAAAQTHTLVLNYDQVEGKTDITPVVTSVLNDSEHVEYSYSKNINMVFGKPVFDTVVSNPYAKPDEQVTLTATVLDMVVDEPVVTYQWQQVSGSAVTLTDPTSHFVSFTVPKTSEPLVFQLVGSNGERDSNPIEIVVNVDSEESSSGGSLWSLLLLFAFISGARGISAHRSTLLNNNK